MFSPASQAQTVIQNEAKPIQGRSTRTLDELWRIDPSNEELLLGQVIRTIADAAGNVYLLDAQLNHVVVIAPDGTSLRTIGREGDGPGEMRGPSDVLSLAGDRLGVVTRFPGRLHIYSNDGIPERTIRLTPRQATDGGYTAIHFARALGEHLIVVGNDVSQASVGESRTWYAGCYDEAGQEIVRYFSRDVVLDFTQPRMVERDIIDTMIFACTASRNHVYLAPFRHEYKIHVYTVDGVLEKVITRDFENRRRDKRELRRIRGVFEALVRDRPDEVEFDIEDLATTVTGLWHDSDGYLWVQHCRSGENRPDNVFRTYDLFDAEGIFARQVSVVCEGDPFRDELFFVGSDLAVLMKDYWTTFYSQMGYAADDEDEAEESQGGIICYRLPSGE
jgi:hypothetical protein